MPESASEIKEKIIRVLTAKGPSLPVHIAKEISQSILFTSAFLSELLSEKKIKMSRMKIGSSSLHFLPGQESQLENFSNYLKSREKDAFLLLKEKHFLSDKEQEPAIKVALREIKDFAIPFQKQDTGETFWRYFTAKEELNLEPDKIEKMPIESSEKKHLNIFDESRKGKERKKKKITKNRKNEKFSNKVKDFLSSKSIEIVNVESFGKDELMLKVKENGREIIFIAYNKKKLDEADIIKAHKKSLESGLNYKILILGEPLKKTKELITALKNLEKIEKIS